MILDFPFNESCLKTYLLILINFWIIKILVLKNIIFYIKKNLMIKFNNNI